MRAGASSGALRDSRLSATNEAIAVHVDDKSKFIDW